MAENLHRIAFIIILLYGRYALSKLYTHWQEGEKKVPINVNDTQIFRFKMGEYYEWGQ